MERMPIIAGIDPGSTVGYAVLDIGGKLILVGSERHLTLNNLISRIIEFGDVIIVGTDKKSLPYFVSQFATKLGARIICPKKDMFVSEKRIATSPFVTRNYHEMDALAAALYAYKDLSPLISRICEFIRIYGKEHIKYQLIKKVVLERRCIKGAAEIIEPSYPVAENSLMSKENSLLHREPETDELRRKVKLYLIANTQLKNHNKRLLRHAHSLRSRLARKDMLIYEETQRRLNSSIYYHEQKIKSLLRQLANKDNVILSLKDSADRLNMMFADIKENILLKKLPTLTQKSYKIYNSLICIQEGDILLVSNPNEYSEYVVNELREKVGIIVYKTAPNKSVMEFLPFIFLDASGIEIIEDRFYASAKRSSFESSLKNKDMLSIVLEIYKKSRDCF